MAFPVLSRSPGATGYTEEITNDAVQIAQKASGLPVVNKLFTFAPKTWKHTRFLVTQADKEAYLTYYEDNKDVPFNWDNEQEGGTPYEVIFYGSPKCQLNKMNNLWKIVFVFMQYSPL